MNDTKRVILRRRPPSRTELIRTSTSRRRKARQNGEGAAHSRSVIEIAEAGILVAALGALLYVAGTSYAQSYFAYFGIGLAEIDGLGVQRLSMLALWIIQGAGWIILTLPLLVLAAAVALRWLTPLLDLHDPEIVTIVAVLAVTLFVGGASLGEWAGRTQAERLVVDGYIAFESVQIVANQGSNLEGYLEEKPEFWESGCVRKIFADARTLFVYEGYTSSGRSSPTYALPRDQIAMIKILRTPNALC